MDYEKLKNEIITDPKDLGFKGKTATQIADILNAPGLSAEKIDSPRISADDVFSALDMVEWATATKEQKDYLDKVLLMKELTPVKAMSNIRTTINSMYDSIPITKAALLDATYKSVSRAEYIGLGTVKRWDVERALDGTSGFVLVGTDWVWGGA